MKARTATEIIEAYLARLAAELEPIAASDRAEFVQEIRSLLVEAAGDDPERANAEVARAGEPADLAAGILAERGLTAEGGMTPADWWRMGLAAPVDIAIGISLPLAALTVAFPVWKAAGMVAWPLSLAMAFYFAITLAWPYYAWRPWWAGGKRLSTGMALTGIAVVRAPGFRRVVRTADLAGMGLPPRSRNWLVGVAVVLVSTALMGFTLGSMGRVVAQISPDAWFTDLAGPVADQELSAVGTVDYVYTVLIKRWPNPGPNLVTGRATSAYEELDARIAKDGLLSYRLGRPTQLGPGVWTVPVTETTSGGKRTVDATVNCRITIQVSGYMSDWVVTDITGEGLTPRP